MTAQSSDFPESDRVPGAKHPRMTPRIFGQQEAVDTFVQAAREGRLHHAWLLTGPRGVGKATFAWMAARWLVSGAVSDDLTTPADHPSTRKFQALSEPALQLVRRPWDDKAKRLQAMITVAEIRKLHSFFHLSAADGGYRIAIIDAADDMNPSAANALLKLLEEPPAQVVMFLIAHQPARLLPTIRSRCRALRLSRLDPEVMTMALADDAAGADIEALSALSDGSVGEALRLTGQDGLARYQQITDLFATMPRLDRAMALKLADAAARRSTEDDGDPFDLIVGLIDVFLARLARTGTLGPPLPQAARGEAETLSRLAPDPAAARYWADAQASLSARVRAGRAVNLDPAALVLDMLTTLAQVPPALSTPSSTRSTHE